jgi:hypothetical protein
MDTKELIKLGRFKRQVSKIAPQQSEPPLKQGCTVASPCCLHHGRRKIDSCDVALKALSKAERKASTSAKADLKHAIARLKAKQLNTPIGFWGMLLAHTLTDKAPN